MRGRRSAGFSGGGSFREGGVDEWWERPEGEGLRDHETVPGDPVRVVQRSVPDLDQC